MIFHRFKRIPPLEPALRAMYGGHQPPDIMAFDTAWDPAPNEATARAKAQRLLDADKDGATVGDLLEVGTYGNHT